jgi:hypothetical protein
MSDVPFYRTQMGHRFYDHTVPELTRNLARIADLLERLVVVLERNADPHVGTESKEAPR